MQHSEQVSLIERALHHLDAKTTDRGSHYRAPLEFYMSPHQLSYERDELFKRYPLVAGFSSQVANAGDYFTFEFAGRSVLIVRDEKGSLGAFANFCRHRGTKLVDGDGHSKRFICPYHAWSYGLDGRLLAAPHQGDFDELGNCRMKPYPVGEKYGLVWVRLQPGAEMNLEKELGPFARDLDSFGFGSHVRFAPRAFRSPINWKLMLEGSLETYHFKYTHKNTIAPMFFDNLGVFDWQAPHGRMFLPKQSIKALKNTDAAEWNVRDVGNLIYFFFPNTVLLVQPDHATWMSAFPLSERESLIHGGTLLPESPRDADAEKYWRKNVDIFWQAINEDYAMSERIQKGLNSGDVDHLHFGRTEFLIENFHREIRSRQPNGK